MNTILTDTLFGVVKQFKARQINFNEKLDTDLFISSDLKLVIFKL